jgi:hypothetical protein
VLIHPLGAADHKHGAEMLGLTIPPLLRMRADKVIE